jgi:DNA transformation protein
MTPIKNMGPKSRVWLHEIGINTLEDLQTIGAVEAYRRLKTTFPTEITLNMLWGLQAAILNTHWKMLTPEMKAELKAQVEKPK